jgi:dethiobiotin synthetase
MRGVLVTGTDTGVGKTLLAAAITAALKAQGVDAIALKPVATGLDGDAVGPRAWPPDHELLALASDREPAETAIVTYGPAVSPHLAAALERRPIDPQALIAEIRRRARGHRAVVVEGVGGLLVPLADRFDVRSLAVALKLPVVVAARPGLGTINHTLLTVEAARRTGLQVAGVVLTPWPLAPDTIATSNLQTIAELGAVEVATLPLVELPQTEELARAAAHLPLQRWLKPCAERQPG